METVQKFMRRYFDERIIEEKREQASRAPFHRKYYASDCQWDSRAGSLEILQSEELLRVAVSETSAEVITTRRISHTKAVIHELRYQLRAGPDGWQIREVDSGCPYCHGEAGKKDCMFCHGTGWLDLSKGITI